MASSEDVVERLRRVLDKPRVKLAVLYGSYARGCPQPQSNVDLALMVEAPSTLRGYVGSSRGSMMAPRT